MTTNECRICYEEVTDNKTYCECKGTMAKVHKECLVKWFDINENMINYKSIIYKECELCKTNIKILISRPKIFLYILIFGIILYLGLFILLLKYSGLRDDLDSRLFSAVLFIVFGSIFMSIIIIILKKYVPCNIKIYTLSN
jgi:hypothetical protein